MRDGDERWLCLAGAGCVKQLLGPEQLPIAHLEHSVDTQLDSEPPAPELGTAKSSSYIIASTSSVGRAFISVESSGPLCVVMTAAGITMETRRCQ